jgi:murein DD-endopeptidase MepM/ murein hydrolase activator NlpD
MLTLAQRQRFFVLLIVALIIAGLVYLRSTTRKLDRPVSSPTPAFSTATPSPAQTAFGSISGIEPPMPSPTVSLQETTPPQPPPSYVGKLRLIVPVAGVSRDQLLDTFTEARSEGRTHDAIDIPAPAGTPVVAAADGEIIKLFQSERGGTTIYQLTTDRKLVLYYAHLQRYADGLAQGKVVRQGNVIAYVGDSGNAGTGNYHLHFSVAIVVDAKRYWEGTNINPFPLLKNP